MANISKNIKQIRIKNNMTQEELAEALFVTRQTISNYETGKSNPDVDTIIKIAEIFKVDTNTVIYGLPLEENQKRARSFAISYGIFLIILLIADFAIDKIFEEYAGFYPPPEQILKFTLFPFTFFVCGFYAMHIIGLFTPLKPLNNLVAKIIRVVIVLILLIIAIPMLYYASFFTFSFIKQLTQSSVHISWPGFYSVFRNILLVIKYPFVFSILGALSWLFGLIYRNK